MSKATKIQPWVIEGLEADRLQELMSPVYVKGFLATYAKFLQLDPAILLSQFPWPQPAPEESPQAAAVPSVPMTIQLPWRWLGRIALIAGACAAVAVVVRTHPWDRLPKLTVHRTSHIKASKVASAKPAPSSQPKPAKVEAPATVQPTLASVTPIPEATNATPPPLTIQPVRPLELAVTATRSTWIRVRADGKLLSQQWLQRGASEHWTARKRFELVIAKPSQVELTLNGQSISPFAIAHRGRLVITHTGVTPLPLEDE